jgi:integrase
MYGRVRFHDLRLTFASLLLVQGENIKFVQSQLGVPFINIVCLPYLHLPFSY